MNPFLFYFSVSLVASVAWTVFVLLAKHENRHLLGWAGVWATSLVLAALWQANAMPWLVNVIQGVLLVWLSAMVVLVMAVSNLWSQKLPLRLPLVSCAMVSLVVSVAAVLHFLWIATVGSGGV